MLSVAGEPPVDLWLSHYRSAEVVIAIVKVSPTGPGLSMTSLWEALGRPPLAATLPGPRALAWYSARDALVGRLMEGGVVGRVRTP